MTSDDAIVYKLIHGNFRFGRRSEFVKYIPVLCEMGYINITLSKAQPRHFSEKYDSISVRVRALTDYDDIGYLSDVWHLVPVDIIVRHDEMAKLKTFLN